MHGLDALQIHNDIELVAVHGRASGIAETKSAVKAFDACIHKTAAEVDAARDQLAQQVLRRMYPRLRAQAPRREFKRKKGGREAPLKSAPSTCT